MLARDGHLLGWLTRADVLMALSTQLRSSESEIETGAAAAELSAGYPDRPIHLPSTPLHGYELLELRVGADSPARERRVADIHWPAGATVVAVTQGREIRAARPDLELQAGERVIVLAPIEHDVASRQREATA